MRANDDADPFLRALNVREIPHRFSGSRGLYAREEVRLLVAFLRSAGQPGGLGLALLPRSLRGLPLAGDRSAAAERLRQAQDASAARRAAWLARRTRTWREWAALRAKRRRGWWRSSTTRRRTCRACARGEVLYRFLQSSGLLARLSREASTRAEARVKNVAKFFDVVKGYGDVAEHDRVPAFVEHLDLLREAGDDPAVAEPDSDDDAVHVLTVHKAKGLEFGVVFLVACAEQKFPVRRRAERAGAAGRADQGAAAGRRRAPDGGAAAVLRRHDARQGRADPDVSRRLRHGKAAQGLALRRRGARPAVADAARAQEPGARGAGAASAGGRAAARA